MAENNESPKPAESGSGSKDKVGDILRKERLTRRITVEAIAKDLKLNVGYVKALEASDYTSLPPEPYIRVYIKSLTKYLSLNTENVLREFDRERGLISENYDKAANKIDISVQKAEKNPMLIVAAALIVVLAVFAFIANQKGWLTPPEDSAAAKADTTGLANADSANREANVDSALATLNAPETSTAATAKATKAPPKP